MWTKGDEFSGGMFKITILWVCENVHRNMKNNAKKCQIFRVMDIEENSPIKYSISKSPTLTGLPAVASHHSSCSSREKTEHLFCYQGPSPLIAVTQALSCGDFSSTNGDG